MPFHHEKLTVYQRALEFASWSQDLIESLTKKTSTRDQLERAGDSIALNIAEGNGKFAIRDRCRYHDFARGSALECAACLDVLVAKQLTDTGAIAEGKQQLFEIVSMLMGLIKSLTSRIGEGPGVYLASGEQNQE